MSSNGVIGTEGFVAWLDGIIYNKVRKACKNIFVKISIHIMGLIAMIFGLYFLITTILSPTSIVGVFLSIIGFVIFLTPLGVNK